jgi:hypothetical protein
MGELTKVMTGKDYLTTAGPQLGRLETVSASVDTWRTGEDQTSESARLVDRHHLIPLPWSKDSRLRAVTHPKTLRLTPGISPCAAHPSRRPTFILDWFSKVQLQSTLIGATVAISHATGFSSTLFQVCCLHRCSSGLPPAALVIVRASGNL